MDDGGRGMKNRKNPIFKEKNAYGLCCWRFRLGKESSAFYLSQETAEKAYVEAIMASNPQYRELLSDKPWGQQRRMVFGAEA